MRNRLGRIEEQLPRPRELNVGGGRKIVTTWEDRYAMLLSAMGDGDHPMLDAVRAGARESDSDEFAQLLLAMFGERVPPSGDEDGPWVDDHHGEGEEGPAYPTG
jgi:hypothetical protein